MKHPRGLKKQRAQGTVDREDAEQSTMPDRWEMKLWHNNRGLIRPPESCRMRVNGLACRPKHRLPPSRAPWGMFPTNVGLGMEYSLIILPGESHALQSTEQGRILLLRMLCRVVEQWPRS